MAKDNTKNLPNARSIARRWKQEEEMLKKGSGPSALPNAYKGSRLVWFRLDPEAEDAEIEYEASPGWKREGPKSEEWTPVKQRAAAIKYYPYRAPGARKWEIRRSIPRQLLELARDLGANSLEIEALKARAEDHNWKGCENGIRKIKRMHEEQEADS